MTQENMTDLSMDELLELYTDRDHTRVDVGVFRRVVKQAMKVESLRQLLRSVLREGVCVGELKDQVSDALEGK